MDLKQTDAPAVDLSLPRMSECPYPERVAADNEDVRRLRVPKHLWDAYTDITGDGGRSSDLKAYIEWRVRNPSKPLPGEKFGPVKRVRVKRATKVEPSQTEE